LCTFDEMAPTKFTKFNFRWLYKAAFPQFAGWLSTVKDDIHSAHCIACKSTFSWSNMGIGEIKFHACGSEHKKYFKTTAVTDINEFLFLSRNVELASLVILQKVQILEKLQKVLATKKEQTIQLIITNDETWKAEILWAMTG
ncbi:hypothetical protein AVEN_31720-1, partial [Araneus ventricosus]